MNNSPRVSVLIADDHALVREGLKRAVDDQSDMVVVGEATNGAEAVTEAQRLSPLIMLLDVSMPGMGGVAVAQALAATCPEVRIIALTRHTDNVFVARMLDAGAAGYVLKQSPTTELLCAIRVVAAGEQYVDSSLHLSSPDVTKAPPPAPAPLEPLSPTEERVLRLLAHAESNYEIARELGLGHREVAELKAAAMQKAGLRTRLDVIAYATQRDWG